MRNDALTVGGIGKLEVEHLCIFLGLLKTITRILVFRFCFNDCNHKVWLVAEKVVSSLLWTAIDLCASDHDSTICKCTLLIYLVIIPTSCVELRSNVFSTSICFSTHSY